MSGRTYIFKEIEILVQGSRRHFEFGPRNWISPNGIDGDFFLMLIQTFLKLLTKFQLYIILLGLHLFFQQFYRTKIFVLTFQSCRTNNLIRKITLILKFMTSQPGERTITIHILPNISRIRGKQAMKFGQLVEYNKKNVYFKIMWKMRQGDQSQTYFCFLKKRYIR